jgi:chromosome partitioning protein
VLDKQIKIAVLSNSGGAGKTTLVRNLAYELARLNLSVVAIDLDPQHNLDLFCGFNQEIPMTDTVIGMLGEKYDRDWVLSSIANEKIDVCRGHLGMSDLQNEFVARRGSEHILSSKFTRSPLPHQIVLIDCPATLGKICENAVVAADYVLIPLILQDKALTGLDGLLDWLKYLCDDLNLNPRPKVLGIVPNAYDRKSKTHRLCMEQLEFSARSKGISLYTTVDYSNEIMNSNGDGLAIGKYRPTHKNVGQFRSVTQQVLSSISA